MNKKIERLWTKAQDPYEPNGNYNGFCPSKTVLPKGYVKKEGCAPIPCDIVWERDVAVEMRDGIIIYTDIYRPVGNKKVPVIISWSPYGKSNIDVPWAYTDSSLSHLQKEEGVDPALWCMNDYAVAHPDARGAYLSQGNISQWGSQEAQDASDYIEWLAQQNWCSGKIGMAGNSYLSIMQWFAAAEQPPHLTAIAPWEGMNDAFRDAVLKGGIPDVQFPRQAISVMHTKNYVDDMPSMAERYPFMNEYWEDKRVKLEKITIPAYIVASYTNPLHTDGTFRGWRNIKSQQKWLRIHNSQEWVDFYKPENQNDLMKFFDHFLKGTDNGWEKTPKVRMSLLNAGGEDVVERIETTFPPCSTKYTKFYLDAQDGRLCPEVPSVSATVKYDAQEMGDQAAFTLEASKRIELAGYPSVHLFLEADGNDDMDVFVMLSKYDKDNQLISWIDTPPNRYQGEFQGNMGRLRISKRKPDEKLSEEHIPVQAFDEERKLAKGEVVCADIHIWPCGMVVEKGEKLVLRVMNNSPYAPLIHGEKCGTMNLVNRGIHIVHTGPDYKSYVGLPIIG